MPAHNQRRSRIHLSGKDRATPISPSDGRAHPETYEISPRSASPHSAGFLQRLANRLAMKSDIFLRPPGLRRCHRRVIVRRLDRHIAVRRPNGVSAPSQQLCEPPRPHAKTRSPDTSLLRWDKKPARASLCHGSRRAGARVFNFRKQCEARAPARTQLPPFVGKTGERPSLAAEQKAVGAGFVARFPAGKTGSARRTQQ